MKESNGGMKMIVKFFLTNKNNAFYHLGTTKKRGFTGIDLHEERKHA